MAKLWQAYQNFGTAIALPISRATVPFPPYAVRVVNRTIASILVGDIPNGASHAIGPYTIDTIPWTLSRSLYVALAPGSSSPGAGDFLEIDFLALDRPGETLAGLGQIVPLPPTGWTAHADPNSLAAVNAGDPFLTSQINQFVDLLTGVMTGQAVTIDNVVTVNQLDLLLGHILVFGDTSGNFKFLDMASNLLRIINSAGRTILWDIDDNGDVQMHNQADLVMLSATDASKKLIVAVGNPAELQIYANDGLTLLWRLQDGGRMIVPTTGASAQPLLNTVSAGIPAPVRTQFPASVDGAWHAISLPAGIPSSAVLVACQLEYVSETGSGNVSGSLASNTTPQNVVPLAIVAGSSGNTINATAILPTNGATLSYRIHDTGPSGDAGLSLTVYAWWEPS